MQSLLEKEKEHKIIVDRSTCKSKKEYLRKQEFFDIISDLIFLPDVQEMKNYSF